MSRTYGRNITGFSRFSGDSTRDLDESNIINIFPITEIPSNSLWANLFVVVPDKDKRENKMEDDAKSLTNRNCWDCQSKLVKDLGYGCMKCNIKLCSDCVDRNIEHCDLCIGVSYCHNCIETYNVLRYVPRADIWSCQEHK